ncbi:PREDICTED: uncharacterized protein LOC109157006 [Ipomoea nil]|uniref:uncharacterized protein LOC109157006 n=1 Tax=Ipomoea nil TaxID=35883 RepID=UPI0009010951|nr:PREDICTED: uncharacterized protein LOC109157006 [Ipomoea nil]
MSKLAEKSLPFFNVMKQRSSFTWTPECQEAFDQFKAYLSAAPVLSKPERGETLYVYLGVAPAAISSVLLREETGIQKPIYYVNKALHYAELRYTPLEKTVYALVRTVRKLVYYFQAHYVIVLTDQPLGTILRNPVSSGRMVKWAVKLSQYSLEYRPRTAIKGQALADFILECTIPERKEGQPEESIGEWEMYTDGAFSKKGCRGGVVLISPEGLKAYQALRFRFTLSNNEAEYEALIGGLRLAQALQARSLKIRSDSQLVVGHVNNQFEAREDRMRQYRDVVQRLLPSVDRWELAQIPRTDNGEADLLSRIAQGVEDHLSYMPKIARTIDVNAPRIGKDEVLAITPPPDEWMQEMTRYKEQGLTPHDPQRARKIVAMAPSYRMIEGRLFKISFGGPMLRCLTRAKADKVIAEVHEGVCAAHQGAQTLARKIILQGYYWLRIRSDCQDNGRKFPTCQQFTILPGKPASYYTLVTSAIPFAWWGVDLAGPFSKGVGSLKFLIVAIDYFTKWVEAEPLASITGTQSRKFMWKNIFTRFGLPQQVVSDNASSLTTRILLISALIMGWSISR